MSATLQQKQEQLQKDPNNPQLQAAVKALEEKFAGHPIYQKLETLTLTAMKLRYEQEEKASYALMTSTEHGFCDTTKLDTAEQHRKAAQTIKDEAIVRGRSAMGRTNSPTRKESGKKFVKDVKDIVIDKVKAFWKLTKKGFAKMYQEVKENPELAMYMANPHGPPPASVFEADSKLPTGDPAFLEWLKDKQEVFAKLWQQTLHDIKHPEQYRARMKAHQEAREHQMLHERAMNAEDYHFKKVEEAAHMTVAIAEAYLGEKLLSSSLKLLFKGVARGARGGFQVLESTGGAAKMKVVRYVKRGEKISDIINEGKGLTFSTGNEHALVKLSDGRRAIVSGNTHGISFEAGQVELIYAHTPYISPTKFSRLPSFGDSRSIATNCVPRRYCEQNS